MAVLHAEMRRHEGERRGYQKPEIITYGKVRDLAMGNANGGKDGPPYDNDRKFYC